MHIFQPPSHEESAAPPPPHSLWTLDLHRNVRLSLWTGLQVRLGGRGGEARLAGGRSRTISDRYYYIIVLRKAVGIP